MNIKIRPIRVMFFLIGIAIYSSICAQDHVPYGLKYQAVARDDGGKPLVQRDVVVKMQIVQMDKDALIWEELHYTSTNEIGLFQLIIGEGFTTGEGLVLDFGSINWGKGTIGVHVYIDFGKGFLDMGTGTLQSVPYAFLADSAMKAPLPDMELGQLKNVSDQKPTKNQPLIWNGRVWLPGDSLKTGNLLVQDELISNQNVIVKGALKIGDSGLITGITADPGLSGASDQTIPTSQAVKSYVDDFQSESDKQELSFDGTTKILSLERGGTVDLSSLVNDADADPSNELQDLQLNSNILSITGISNPATIDLAPYQGVNTDNQELTLTGTLLEISGGNQVDLSPIQDGTEDADADPANELQSLSVTGSNLSISGGNTVNLGSLNTDDQNLILNNHLLTIENGNTITLPDNVNDADADPSNELQNISLNNTFLSITNGNTIDLSPIQDGYDPNTDEQNLSIAGHQLSIENGNTVTLPDNVNDADADPTNEIQDLQLDGNILTITGNINATDIDLSPYQGTNTDNQTLSLSGTSLSITGGNSVDLSSLPDNVDDADANPSNELQNLSLTGNNLSISSGNTVNLGSINTDDQNLILNNHQLTIENGNTITLPDNVNDADADPSNELQDISLSSTFLSITNGSTIDLSPIQDGYEPNTDEQNLSIAGHQLSIENGNTVTLPDNVNDADADPSNELQDISLSSTFLSITNGSTIDLSPIQDGYEPNTDDQNLILNNHQLTIENGNTITLPDNVNDADADPANELQTLSISGNVLSISNGNSVEIPTGGTDADADPTNEIQDLQLVGNILTITGNVNATDIDLSPYQGTNTDNQTLSLSGTSLSITGGNSVDLSSLPDNVNDADADPTNELQDISLAGTNLSISDGSTVDLSTIRDGYEPNTDDQNLAISGHLLTIEDGNTVTLPDNVNDADADPANELQDISLTNTFLSISNGSTIDLSVIQDGYEPNTDDQNLILNGHLLTIENGNTITLPDNVNDADADPANELQDISLTGTNLSITNGSTVDLSSIDTDTDTDDQTLSLSGTNLTISEGNTVNLAPIDTDTHLSEAEVDAYVANNGYLTNETDPVFTAHVASSITGLNISHWNTAYGWGNHALAGYLTSEADPIFLASPAASITLTYIDHWNLAYGWGNHALAGYLTSEADPIFLASPAASITSININHWNLAYGWGDHSLAGYLTSESDPIFSASPAATILLLDISRWNEAFMWGDHSLEGYLKNETDPIFSGSVAAGITSTDTANWNEAYSWGDHSLEGYLTSENDPIFSSSPAAGITLTAINHWNLAYSWGNHALAGYLTTETDPIFSASPAAGITNSNINTWNSYVNYWNITGSDIYVLGRHVGIGTSSPAASLHVADNDVVFTAPYALPGAPDAPPVSGQGTRMMWYADKAAFRVGSVQGTNWDGAQIGNYSFASGYNPLASGLQSIAMSAQATGDYSVAIGNGAIASANSSIALASGQATAGRSIAIGTWANATNSGSVAIGEDVDANGQHSTALGFQTVADGNYSTVMGLNTKTSGGGYGATAMGSGSHASNHGSTAMGANARAAGETSTAMGRYTQALGQYSTATGNYTTASGYNAFSANMYTTAQSYASGVFGRYNIIAGDSVSWINTDPLFVLGNGSSSSSRNNAVTVFKNGNMDVDGDVTAARFFGDGSGLTGVGGTTQCLSWNSSTRQLSISGCAGYVTISDYWETDTDDQTLSIAGHTLSIQNGNSVTLPDNQTLSIAGHTLSILNGNSVTLPDNVNDADADPTNELQTLGFSGYSLSLSPSGGSATLPWANNGSAYAYTNRNIGINTTTPSNDFVIYDASGYLEMDYNSISLFGEGAEKIGLMASAGYPGWIGTKGPANSYNAVIGYVTGYPDFGSIGVLNDGSNFRAGMQVNSNGTGTMYVQGPNDNDNFLATYLSPTYPNNGWASVNDASGNAQAYMYVNSAGDGVIRADDIAAPLKNFRIPHPELPGYEIVYACIEGPEAAAYVRGTAELSNGSVDIVFPDHFQYVATEVSMTIMLTPLSADSKGLAVVEKSTSGFSVRELSNGTGTYAFDWEAKCIRKGYEDYEVIQESTDIVNKGSQPKGGGMTDNSFPAPKNR